MRTAWMLAPLLLAGCGSGDARGDSDSPPTDTVAAAPAAGPALSTFDPGALQPGDTVLGLTVVSKDVQRAMEDSVWVGNVVFAGDLLLQGVYQPHFDWPEVMVPCFHVTDPASIARIPRFPPDAWTSPSAKTWFCFSNPEVALELLGSPDQPREAVIALSRYQVWRSLSDAFDEAELSELLEVGASSTATLTAR